jgi:hypothetical protein
MSTTQPCISCQQANITPVPCVPGAAPCNGEKCAELYPAQCVQYQDAAPLTAIGSAKNDMLNVILQRINAVALGNTQAVALKEVAINDTNGVDLSGNGLSTDPITATLRVDPVSGNLLQVTPAGVRVLVNKAVVLSILNIIRYDQDLINIMCEITKDCNPCNVANITGSTLS